MDSEIGTWDVAKLDIKPGQILVIRWDPPKFPGPGGSVSLPAKEAERLMELAKKSVRSALDQVGLTSDKVPVLVTTSAWDLLLLRPLDLLDACATASKNEQED